MKVKGKYKPHRPIGLYDALPAHQAAGQAPGAHPLDYVLATWDNLYRVVE